MADTYIRGLDEVQKFFSESPDQMLGVMHAGLLGGAALIEAQAKANCPIGDPGGTIAARYGLYAGALRDSIQTYVTVKGNKVSATIKAGGVNPRGADVYYAHLIEFSGAAPHIIKAKNGGTLAFGGHAYKEIHHPGMRPHPFLRPALDANELTVIGLLDQQIDIALK